MNRYFKRKKRNYPDFWETYERSFDEALPDDLDEAKFVVLDTETTGFDVYRDRILCIGALILQGTEIEINNSLEIYLHQENYNAEAAKIHGILKKGKANRIEESEALRILLGYLGNSVVVGHHTRFDISLINKALHRNGLPNLKNPVLDTDILYKKTLLRSNLLKKKESYSLDDLADKFDISKKDRHTALGDAYITAIAFLMILSNLREKGDLSLKKLVRKRRWWE